MLNTSEPYKTAVVSSPRQSTALLSWGIFNINAKSDVTIEASEKQDFVNLLDLIDNIKTIGKNIATFEGLGFPLDGTKVLCPDNVGTSNKLGWWSLNESNESGNFDSPPFLTFTFGNPYSSLGIEIVFDIVGGSYCPSFDIVWYDGDNQLSSKSITDNADTICSVENNVENFNKIVITFNSTNIKYEFAKILEINLGIEKIFTSDDIIEGNLLEEVDPIGAVITVNTMKIKLSNLSQDFNMINPSGLYKYLQARQPLVIQSGLLLPGGASYEYVDLGTYYLSKWDNPTGITTTLEATDIFSLFDKATYYNSQFWVNESFRNVLTQIINDSGVGITFTIDTGMENEVVNGYIPIMSYREALQTLLLACRGAVQYNRDGALYIFKPDYGLAVKTIDYSTIINVPKISQKPLITTVQATDHVYTPGSFGVLYQSTFTLVGTQTYHIPYNNAPVQTAGILIELTGDGTISGEPIYSATTCTLTIIGTGELTLTISGTSYIDNTKNVSASLDVIPGGGTLQIATLSTNNLFSGGNTAVVCQSLLDYYQHRITQTFDFWDDPALQAGDNVSVESMFGTNQSGIVEQNEITFAPNLKARLMVTG